MNKRNSKHGNKLSAYERRERSNREDEDAYGKLTEREKFDQESHFLNADGLWIETDSDKKWGNATTSRTEGLRKSYLCDACLEARDVYNLSLTLNASAKTVSNIPFDEPQAVVKRAIYQIGRMCQKYDLQDALAQLSTNAASTYVAERRRSPSGRRYEEKSALLSSRLNVDIDRRRLPDGAPSTSINPFYHVFNVALPEAGVITKLSGTVKKVEITNSRMKVSQALLYASRHKVPVELLTDFLHQIGGDKIIADRLKGQRPNHSNQPTDTLPSDIKENWWLWKEDKTR